MKIKSSISKIFLLTVVFLIISNSSLQSQSRWATNVITKNYIKFLHQVNNDLYALTEQGIYFSTDHGNFWSCMIIDTSLVSYQANYETKVMANIGNQVFIASPYFGIFSTTDFGLTWSELNSGLGSLFVISIISKGTLLFAGTSDNGIYFSSDQGLSWSAVNSGLTNLNVTSFAIDGNKIFAGTFGGVFISTNNGGNWTARNSGLTSLLMESLFFVKGNLFAGTHDSGVYLTTNSGLNWERRSTGLSADWVSCFTSSGNHIFAGTYYDGIFSSSNNGGSWNPVNSGLGTNPIVNSLITYEDKILAGMIGNPEGIYFTTNLGGNWNQLNYGLTSGSVYCLAGYGNEIFTGSLGLTSSLFKSTNNGSSWTDVGIVTSTNSFVFSMLYKPPYYFTAVGYAGIFRSPDNNFVWTSSDSGDVFNNIIEKNGIIFTSSGNPGGKDGGINKSSDDSINWISVNSGLSTLSINSIVVSGNNLIAGTDYGIFYSSNDGIGWIKSQTPDNQVKSMITIGSETYAASRENGISVSSNNGISWEPRNSGLPNLDFYLISGNEELLIVCGNNGIYISPDNGYSWTPYNLGLTWSIRFSKFYINKEYIFASSYTGVFRLNYSDLVGINNVSSKIPVHYFLHQNYPNPFNPQTKIKFEISKSSIVKLRIFDMLGKGLQTLIDKSMTAGIYEVEFDGANFPSGIYFYRIEISPDNSNEKITGTKQMILLK